MAAPEKKDGSGFPVGIVATTLRVAACVLAVAAPAAAAGVWILRESRTGAGEPVLLFSGMSLWPAEITRLAAAALSAGVLGILSRSPLFDNWVTPYPLMLVFGSSAAYAAACAFKLRHVAERARIRALDRFTYLLVHAKGEGGSPSLAGQIETMIKESQALHWGAFAPFTEQPVVRALLVPISSVGGMSLLLRSLGWGDW